MDHSKIRMQYLDIMFESLIIEHLNNPKKPEPPLTMYDQDTT